jgi:hypothetical protein
MQFSGIDRHSDNSFVVASGEADKVLNSRHLPINLGDICSALSPQLEMPRDTTLHSR